MGKSNTVQCLETYLLHTSFSHIHKIAKIAAALKDAFGEVIFSIVMKTPKYAPSNTLQKLWDMTKKCTSIAVKGKTMPHILTSQTKPS